MISHLDVLVDYTHGFAFAAAHKSEHEASGLDFPIYGLSTEAYLKGLDLILR